MIIFKKKFKKEVKKRWHEEEKLLQADLHDLQEEDEVAAREKDDVNRRHRFIFLVFKLNDWYLRFLHQVLD